MLTLSSDFGSPYPAAMKGVILQRTDARLVDVAHDFPRQDVRATAFWLREVLPYFPPAVHLVVVDPGVGTDRAAVAIRAGGHAIVAPDNGVAIPVARELADGRGIEVFEVEYDDRESRGDSESAGGQWPHAPESSTFHGRDVFAPAAAEVHEAGIDRFHDHGWVTAADDYVDLTFPEPTLRENGAEGEILVVDGFGNAISNVPGEVLEGAFGGTVTVDGERAPAREYYAAVDPGQRLVTVGSHGNVELAVNRGRGDDAFDARVGDRIELSL